MQIAGEAAAQLGRPAGAAECGQRCYDGQQASQRMRRCSRGCGSHSVGSETPTILAHVVKRGINLHTVMQMVHEALLDKVDQRAPSAVRTRW
jgi:hypothetical protein